MKTRITWSLLNLILISSLSFAGEGGSIGTAGGGNLPDAVSLLPREIEIFVSQGVRTTDGRGTEFFDRAPHGERYDYRNFRIESRYRLQAFGAPAALEHWIERSYNAERSTIEQSFSMVYFPDRIHLRAGVRTEQVLDRVEELQIWMGGDYIDFPDFVARIGQFRRSLDLDNPQNLTVERLAQLQNLDFHFFEPLHSFLNQRALMRSGLDAGALAQLDSVIAPVFPEAARTIINHIRTQDRELEFLIDNVVDAEGRCLRSRYARVEAMAHAQIAFVESLQSSGYETLYNDSLSGRRRLWTSWYEAISRIIEAREMPRLEGLSIFQRTVEPACRSVTEDATPVVPASIILEDAPRRRTR